jgi:MarR family transcriptional regulator, organic hydroperoxide resistance regulator
MTERGKDHQGAFTKRDQEFIRRVGWDIDSISSYLDELRNFWARMLGITGPQWRIILVLAEIDDGFGVPVNYVSKMLHVDSSFVTTQSKLLEKNGFIRRTASSQDGRIVKLSSTEKTRKHLANLTSPQEKLNEFIFAEFAPLELEELAITLDSLKQRLAKACLKVAADY